MAARRWCSLAKSNMHIQWIPPITKMKFFILFLIFSTPRWLLWIPTMRNSANTFTMQSPEPQPLFPQIWFLRFTSVFILQNSWNSRSLHFILPWIYAPAQPICGAFFLDAGPPPNDWKYLFFSSDVLWLTNNAFCSLIHVSRQQNDYLATVFQCRTKLNFYISSIGTNLTFHIRVDPCPIPSFGIRQHFCMPTATTSL